MPISCSDHFHLIGEWNESRDISVLPCVSKLGIFGGTPAIDLPISGSGKVKEASRLDFNNILTF
jgi:hypothetical protein